MSTMEIHILMNTCFCPCGVKCSSLKRLLNHAINSGHEFVASCYCETRLDQSNVIQHSSECRYLGIFGCKECNSTFKDLVSAHNHGWSAHGSGRWTPILSPTIVFQDEFEAQNKKVTKWDHMQWNQIESRARNNSLKRTMIRDLLLESDFTASGSKIFKLAQLSRGRLPAFKRTLNNRKYMIIPISCDDGTISVLLNPADKEYRALRNAIDDYAVLETQSLFDVGLKVDWGDRTTELVETLTQCLKQAGTSLDLIQKIVSFACKVTVAIKSNFEPLIVGALILDMLITQGISSSLANEVMSFCKDKFASAMSLFSDNFVAQVADDEPYTNLATVLAVVGGTLLMKRMPSFPEISGLLKSLAQLGVIVRGASFAWSGFEKLIKFTFAKIFEWHTGCPASIGELDSAIHGCREWYCSVQNLVEKSTSEEIARDPQKVLQVQSLVREGLKIKAQLEEFRVEPKLIAAFDIHFRVLQLYMFEAQSSGAFRGGPRIEPINIYLYGESGVGKTGLIQFLAIDLLKIDGVTKRNGKVDYTEELYYRAIEQEFWDGYVGQRIVVYDDFGQLIDSQQKPNLEYMEMIRTGNLAPMPLHMAHLQDKAKSFFTSRVVIATSNNDLSRVKIPSLSQPEAFKRRIDICVEVLNDVRFTKQVETGNGNVRRLDLNKVEKITGKAFSTEPYRFQLREVSTGHAIGPIMNYEEFRNKCVHTYQVRARDCTALASALAEHASTPFVGPDVLDAQINPEIAATLADENNHIVLETDVSEMLQDWSIIQCKRFLEESYPEMSLMFSPQARKIFNRMKQENFFGRFDECDAIHLEELKEEWCRRIVSVPENDWYADDATTQIREIFVGKNPRHHLSLTKCLPIEDRVEDLQCFVQHVSLPKSERQSVVEHLKNLAKESFGLMQIFLEKVKKTIQDHPWLCIVGVVVSFFSFRLLNTVRKIATMPPLDHNHLGLQRGKRLEHGHLCEVCGVYFRHTHTIKSYEESIRYDQMCEVCTRVVALEVYDRADDLMKNDAKEQIRMMCGWIQTPITVKTELSSSGDSKTPRVKPPSTQLGSSGDAKTPKKSVNPTQITNVEIGSSGDEKTVKVSRPVTQSLNDVLGPVVAFDMKEMEAQLQSDPNSLQVSKKVLNNMYNLELKIDGQWREMLKLMMICGRIGLTAGHLTPFLERATDIKIWNASKAKGHEFPVSDINWVFVCNFDGEKKDQILIEFPPGLHDHFSLLGNIATSEELSKFTRARACVVVPFDKGAILRTGPVTMMREKPRKYCDSTTSYVVADRFEYIGMETAAGDCGSPLVAIGTTLARKIVGIHVCGKYQIGVASPLNLRDIEDALRKLPMEAQLKMEVDSIVQEVDVPWNLEMPEGNFTAVGKSLYRVAMPVKTALRKSLVYEKIAESTTKPADLRLPALERGLKKAGDIPPNLDTRRVTIAIDDVKRIVNAGERENARVLTKWEAITGIEGDEFIQPIKRHTSPGYPYTGKARKLPGKCDWLGQNEDYRLDENLSRQMDERIEKAKRGERTPSPFIDTLKDERRPIEKVDAGKTRVFSAGAMDFTLVFRMYFLAFAAHVMRHRIGNEISVGTNPYSYDWSKTAKRVSSKGKKVIAGDFSNFDGTLLLPVLYQILDIINDFYDDGNDLIRHVLWKEIVNSIHVKGNTVYLWTHSQPSGCPITAILNSLFNSISMRYVWLSVAPQDYCTMRAFNEHVAMVSYGDDNVVNISDEVIGWFNQVTIAGGYEKIGMTYTDEGKTGTIIPFRTLEECAYLKRGFVWHEEELQWFAPLDMSTILEMTNWIRGDLDQEEATIENVQTSAFEMHFHGREIYDKWRPIYWNACRHLELRPALPHYDEHRYDVARQQGRFV